MRIGRRGLLGGAAALLAADAIAQPLPDLRSAGPVSRDGRDVALRLVAAERPLQLGGAGGPLVQGWTFGEDGLPVPAPVEDPVRDVVVLRQLPGTPLAASVRQDGAAALHPEHVLALLDALPAAALKLPVRAS